MPRGLDLAASVIAVYCIALCITEHYNTDHKRGCGGAVDHNNTYLHSPGWPDSYTVTEDTVCSYTFNRVSYTVCQVGLYTYHPMLDPHPFPLFKNRYFETLWNPFILKRGSTQK